MYVVCVYACLSVYVRVCVSEYIYYNNSNLCINGKTGGFCNGIPMVIALSVQDDNNRSFFAVIVVVVAKKTVKKEILWIYVIYFIYLYHYIYNIRTYII